MCSRCGPGPAASSSGEATPRRPATCAAWPSLAPIGVLCEVTNDDGTMARGPELRRFAVQHGLVTISVADIVAHRRRIERTAVTRTASARIPTRHGEFTATSYVAADGSEHVALVHGVVAGQAEPVLVRVHSECFTGDIAGSVRCDCGDQLATAMARIAAAGRGAVVYLKGHEGRGIGLAAKLRAYALQDTGLDTVEANLAQGLPADARDYGDAAAIIGDLGVTAVRLMTNNPDKVDQLVAAGIDVADREPIQILAHPESIAYLEAKRDRLHHWIDATPQAVPVAAANAR